MELIRNHTDEGQFIAVIVDEDKKFYHLKYANCTEVKRVAKSQEIYFTYLGEATPDQLDRVLHGAKKYSEDSEA